MINYILRKVKALGSHCGKQASLTLTTGKNIKPVNPLLLSNTLIYNLECTNQKGHCQKIDLGGFFNIKTQSLDTLMPKARAPFLGP